MPHRVSYIPAETKNVPPQISAAISSGYASYKDFKDGIYNYIDLLNILEIIEVYNENRYRDFEHNEMLRRQAYYGSIY
jgi:hypothetical protein